MHPLRPEQELRRSQLHRLRLCWLHRQPKVETEYCGYIDSNSAIEQYCGSQNFKTTWPLQRRVETYFMACTFRQADSNSTQVVYIVSHGVVTLSKNPVHHNALKYIEIRYHFVQDCVSSGKVTLEKISTINNVLDGMTKCLIADRFRSLRHQMGLRGNQLSRTNR